MRGGGGNTNFEHPDKATLAKGKKERKKERKKVFKKTKKAKQIKTTKQTKPNSIINNIIIIYLIFQQCEATLVKE